MSVLILALYNGQQLNKGDILLSTNGVYNLSMQNDGNLVLYNGNNSPIWATGTVGSGDHFIMQGDGNAVVYRLNGSPVWATATDNTGANRIVMQEDGNLVVYDKNNTLKWASGTSGR